MVRHRREDLQPLDSTVDVVTPENISFQYELAGPFRRAPAFLIDFAIRLAIWLALLVVVSVLGFNTGSGPLVFSLWLLAWFVLEWFYGGLLEAYFNGQTFGKRMLGLRVLRVDGQPINGLQAVMRNILRFVDMMPLIPWTAIDGDNLPFAIPTFLFGVLTPAMNRRYQRLGDLVCGTMVVVEERQWTLALAKLEDPALRQLAESLPVNFVVSHKLSRALARYVERRRYMSPGRRTEIAYHLGQTLSERMNLPLQQDYDPLLCALYLRTFVLLQSGRAELSAASAPPIVPGSVTTMSATVAPSLPAASLER